MSGIFDDIISKEELKKAKKSLNPLRNSQYRLDEEVSNATYGLEKLINAVNKCQTSLENTEDLEIIEDIKKNMDKIAYLMDKFVDEFKPAYEDIIQRYMAEQLAGTFEKHLLLNGAQTLSSHSYYSNGKQGWDQPSK